LSPKLSHFDIMIKKIKYLYLESEEKIYCTYERTNHESILPLWHTQLILYPTDKCMDAKLNII